MGGTRARIEIYATSGFTSVPHLEKCLREYLESYNENPRALVWTKSVEEILEKVRRGREELSKTT